MRCSAGDGGSLQAMTPLLVTEFFSISLDAAARIVFVERSARPLELETAELYKSCMERCLAAIAHVDRPSHGIVVDQTLAPRAADLRMESLVREAGRTAVTGFRAFALVVASESGGRQSKRIEREERFNMHIFQERQAALGFVREKLA